jgi:transposase
MATSLFRENFPQTKELQQEVDDADYIIGLDLHKQTTAITVLDTARPDTPVFQRKRLRNERLCECIQSFSGAKIIVAESAYGWFPLRTALAPLEDSTFIIYDARKTAAWISASGIKSDRIDSEVLAHACLKGGTKQLAVYQPEYEAKEQFRLSTLRGKLVQHRTMVKNQLHAIERDYGTNPYTGESIEQSPLVSHIRTMLMQYYAYLNEQITDCEDHMAPDDITHLLTSIPGIGPLTAHALRWKIGSIDRFTDAAHLCSYFGFGIRQYQSGTTCVKGKITKQGNALIRALLVQGAQVIRATHPEYLSLYFPSLAHPDRMKNRVHANKVVVALARKHLTFVYHMWKNKTPFSIAEYRKRRETSPSISLQISSRAAELEPHLVH